jgi:hypothetical protein
LLDRTPFRGLIKRTAPIPESVSESDCENEEPAIGVNESMPVTSIAVPAPQAVRDRIAIRLKIFRMSFSTS